MKSRNTGKNRIADRLPAILLALALLAAWQVAAMSIGQASILPAPTDILVRIWELRESLFLEHLPTTLETVAAGWGLAILVGVLLAVLMHFSPHAEAMLYPAMSVTQTVPVMCISPLFVLWLGYTLGARLLAVVLSTFFAIALNTFDGLGSVDPAKEEWLRTCGAGKKEIFFHLAVPTALPRLMTALKMTFPWAVIDAAVAEWLGATDGLGYFSKRMVSKLDGAGVFAPVVILCLVSLVGMAVLNLVDRKWVTWRNEV